MMRYLTSIALGVCFLGFAAHDSSALEILAPGDFILAIDVDEATGSRNPPSGAENAPFVADGLATTKYLNFGDMPAGGGALVRGNTGFIVTPATPGTIVQSFVLTTANDSPERDPATWVLWGTNESIVSVDNGSGSSEHWTRIANGTVTLPDTPRQTAGPIVSFANSTAYNSYRMTFPTLKNSATANSMQLAEAAFFESTDGSGANILIGNSLVVGYKESFSRYPAAEGPANLVDGNSATKYLNFAEENSGFIVTPASGPSTVTSFTITTANDAPDRDPASWILYGTNSPIGSIDNSTGNIDFWTEIGSGSLSLPADRFATSSQIAVSNSTEYASYRMVFPTVKNATAANSMQIADVQFYSTDPVRLEINRATGEMKLVADSAQTVGSYVIRSATYGALVDSNWNSIAENADFDSGASKDNNDIWLITSDPGDPFEIGEEDAPGMADDGAPFAASQFYSLGDIWLTTPYEDIFVEIYDGNGDLLSNTVSYINDPRILGDYSNDGFVNIDDWAIFRAGLGGQYDNLTIAQAYMKGDLDGDFDSDLDDFNLFVEAAGGIGALFGTTVPEPSSVALWIVAGLGLIGYQRFRVRAASVAAFAFAIAAALIAGEARAQTFVSLGIPSTATSPDPNEAGNAGPINLFDDSFVDGQINTDLFTLDYNSFTVPPLPLQYAGLGAGQKRVFMDFGSTISNINWFAYAQRSGGDATADRVGMFEFWFSDADFMNALPATPPDAVLKINPDDPRLRDSVLRPYTLSGEHSGRYAAMRITVSALSANQPTNNIGGHEFRFMQGPSDIVLTVDRSNGNVTMSNSGSLAQSLNLKAYEIRSDLGGLDASGYNGIRGDDAAFVAGTGMGDGWELGGGSGANRLFEAYFSGSSTYVASGPVLNLGSAYNEFANTEDLIFRYTDSQGRVYDGRVEYTGTAPGLPGDYNNDGLVNAGDYVVWRDNLNSTTANLPNDSTPALVDQSDYDRWKQNFGAGGMGSGAGSATIPEPGAMALAGFSMVIVGAIGVRRRLR